MEGRRVVKSVPIARWDALGEIIKAARARGVAVHVWYSFTHYESPESPEFNPRHKGNPAWAARRVSERVPEKAAGSKYPPIPMEDVCPLHPEARRWQLDLIETLVDRYPALEGIHIEEPGYGYPDFCVCDSCLGLLKRLYGVDQHQVDVHSPLAKDLKCLGTTDFVRSLRERLRLRNPKLVLSTNGGSSWKVDRSLGRDWVPWARFGWLDFYAAQIYTSDQDEFGRSLQAVIDVLGRDSAVAAGVRIEDQGRKNSVETMLRQISIARERGAQGIILFHGKALTEDYLAALKAGPFKQQAALPRNAR
jgi:uncharacterized lipoprotein YddW (UPF0748 family)